MATLELLREDGGRVSVDSLERSIKYENKKVLFTETEWALLKGLYFQVGKPVKRSFLLSLLKEDHNEDTRIVDVHVSSIRKKLSKIKVAKIRSVYGVGYLLCQSKNK